MKVNSTTSSKKSFLSKKTRNLNVHAEFIFNNIENIPNNRINFLKNHKVNKEKLDIFAKVPYSSIDNDNDGLYDPNEGSFILSRESDIKQNLNQISHGELSQLYFAIRLALGKKCLDKGFILMENPFLASDEERFEEQVKLIRSFVETGWQIIILIAKRHTEEKLVEMGGNSVHQLKRIN